MTPVPHANKIIEWIKRHRDLFEPMVDPAPGKESSIVLLIPTVSIKEGVKSLNLLTERHKFPGLQPEVQNVRVFHDKAFKVPLI